MPKICIAASAGGHLSQALRVAEAYQSHPHFFVTTSRMAADQLGEDADVRFVDEANRSNPFRLLRIIYRAFQIVRSERPHVILSTGAAPGCLLCLVGKLYRAKIIWMDSLANVERMSLSGRIIARFADLLLVQWEDVAASSPRAEYAGSVL